MITIRQTIGFKITSTLVIPFALMHTLAIYWTDAAWFISTRLYALGITSAVYDPVKWICYALFVHSIIHDVSVDTHEKRLS